MHNYAKTVAATLIDSQWLCDIVTKFAMWQHPAIMHEAVCCA